MRRPHFRAAVVAVELGPAVADQRFQRLRRGLHAERFHLAARRAGQRRLVVLGGRQAQLPRQLGIERGNGGGSTVIGLRRFLEFPGRGAGAMRGRLAAGAAVPGIVRRWPQAGAGSHAGVAAVDRGIEQFGQRRPDRLRIRAMCFGFRGFVAGFFRGGGGLRHARNMGRVRCREKGYGAFRNPAARRSVALSAVVSTSHLTPSCAGLTRASTSCSHWRDEKTWMTGLNPPMTRSAYRTPMHDINPKAGKPVEPSMLANIPRLVTAYFAGKPDPEIAAQRVAFGTSGHRGSAFNDAFNEAHILAISQAHVRSPRERRHRPARCSSASDTHALAEPALRQRARSVRRQRRRGDDRRARRLHADAGDLACDPDLQSRPQRAASPTAIVVTPSHNPPEDGGFKYNPPNGGPADTDVTGGIERAANRYLADGLDGVKRIPYERARKAACVHRHDYIDALCRRPRQRASTWRRSAAPASRSASIRSAARRCDYWEPIIERYGLNATVVSDAVDPTFRFMTLDWDGKIRMDCSLALRDGATDRHAR